MDLGCAAQEWQTHGFVTAHVICRTASEITDPDLARVAEEQLLALGRFPPPEPEPEPEAAGAGRAGRGPAGR